MLAVGGTDSPYNVALSDNRALTTENVFVSFGMNRAIFHTVGWADTHPVTGVQGFDAGTIDALNRRIVIFLVVALLVTAKLIDWRNRWNTDSRPFR